MFLYSSSFRNGWEDVNSTCFCLAGYLHLHRLSLWMEGISLKQEGMKLEIRRGVVEVPYGRHLADREEGNIPKSEYYFSSAISSPCGRSCTDPYVIQSEIVLSLSILVFKAQKVRLISHNFPKKGALRAVRCRWTRITRTGKAYLTTSVSERHCSFAVLSRLVPSRYQLRAIIIVKSTSCGASHLLFMHGLPCEMIARD